MSPQEYMELRIPSDREKEAREWIDKHYDGIGVFPTGYWRATGQIALEIILEQHKPLEDQLGILDFIPYIEPWEYFYYHEDGTRIPLTAKWLGVFEYTLSEDGVYYVGFTDSGIYLVKTEWGRPRLLQEFDDVMTMLRYIYEHHPRSLPRNLL